MSELEPPRWPHVLTMGWHDLAFLHWALEPKQLERMIPPGLHLETFNGKAWIGLVPFRMSAVRPRGFPRWKWITDFPEMNVRTYVTDGKVSGVWFFSLDATQPIAVWAARKGFHLPYFNASIALQWAQDWHYYSCIRTEGRESREFAGRYRPTGAPTLSLPGTLEHFLSERYWLFSSSPKGQNYRARIHHVPWPLQPAEVEIQRCSYMEPYGVTSLVPDAVHFAREIFVDSWALEKV